MQSRNNGQKAVCADIPQCLCEQIHARKADKPRLTFSHVRGQFILWCPTCGFKTYPDENKQSVIAEWYGCNRPRDSHIAALWIERFERQQQESLAQREIEKTGAVVPL